MADQRKVRPMYVPGDEYRYPQYAKRGFRRWECTIENKFKGFGRTREAALKNALENQANRINFRGERV